PKHPAMSRLNADLGLGGGRQPPSSDGSSAHRPTGGRWPPVCRGEKTFDTGAVVRWDLAVGEPAGGHARAAENVARDAPAAHPIHFEGSTMSDASTPPADASTTAATTPAGGSNGD